ncbi:T6SS phospholipase effector Tle1-like catalytic domain-containing protein [Pseudomonas putida]
MTNSTTPRIGLFFDGTGNHAANALFDDATPSDLGGSHASALTNIHKLCQLYSGTQAIYVPGIGTEAGQSDSLIGSALGRGRTGVLARSEYAVAQVREMLAANNSLTVDLFGFSRGAAAARHCANQLTGVPGVQMGFIGLFDTVAAVAGVVKLDLHLAPARFPHVVQLVARDERREHFALTQLCDGHTELEVPGAHADIGGGYLAVEQEKLLIWPMQALTVGGGTQVHTTSIYRHADQERQLWLARGWPAEWLQVITPPATLVADRNQPPQKQVYAATQLQREVRGELSRLYLRVMHAMAVARGVPLQAMPATAEHALPADLQPLEKRFLRGDFALGEAEERLLMLNYIHVSAHWNPPAGLQGNAPRIGTRALCINAPTTDGIRVRHRH